MKLPIALVTFMFLSSEAFADTIDNSACEREIVACALTKRVQSVPVAGSLLGHSFSISGVRISNDFRTPSIVGVEMTNRAGGSSIVLNYSVKRLNAETCEVQADLLAD